MLWSCFIWIMRWAFAYYPSGMRVLISEKTLLSMIVDRKFSKKNLYFASKYECVKERKRESIMLLDSQDTYPSPKSRPPFRINPDINLIYNQSIIIIVCTWKIERGQVQSHPQFYVNFDPAQIEWTRTVMQYCYMTLIGKLQAVTKTLTVILSQKICQ